MSSSFFAGFAGSPGFYARGGQQFADNLLRFAAKAADENLYVSYVIVHPTVDRAKPAHQQSAGVRQPVKSSPNSVTSPPEFRSSKA